MENIIQNFIKNDQDLLDLGIRDSSERKLIHTISSDNDIYSNTIRERFGVCRISISKYPFDQDDFSLIREFKYLTDVSCPDTIKTINDFEEYIKYDLELSKEFVIFTNIIKNNFSGEFYLFCEFKKEHIIDKIAQYLKDKNPKFPDNIYTETEQVKFLGKQQFFVQKNNNKKFIRFDMISASSNVIGIKNWYDFMSQFTDIDIVKKSKNLKRKIMYDFASIEICENAIMQRKLDFVHKLLPLVNSENIISIGRDDISIEFDENIDYDILHQEIDPNKNFRKEVFTLKFVPYNDTSFFVEDHGNNVKKIKCLTDNSKRREIEKFVNENDFNCKLNSH